MYWKFSEKCKAMQICAFTVKSFWNGCRLVAMGGRVTSAIACNGNSSYGTLNGVGVTYCYCTFLFFFLFLLFFFHLILSRSFMEIHWTKVDGTLLYWGPLGEELQAPWNGSRWLPLPWKRNKCEKFQFFVLVNCLDML